MLFALQLTHLTGWDEIPHSAPLHQRSYPSCPMCAVAAEQLFTSFHLGFCFCLALTTTNHITTMAILIVPKADRKTDPLHDSHSETPEKEAETNVLLVPSPDSFLACNPFFARTWQGAALKLKSMCWLSVVANVPGSIKGEGRWCWRCKTSGCGRWNCLCANWQEKGTDRHGLSRWLLWPFCLIQMSN